MSYEEYLILFLGTGIAAALKSGAGIGSGLFLLPTLSMVFEPFFALALSVPLLLFMDFLAVGYHWKRWLHSPCLTWMAVFSVLGVSCGVFAVPYLSDTLLKLLIGSVGTCYGLWNLLPRKRLSKLHYAAPRKFNRNIKRIYLASFIGGLFNIINAGSIFYAYALMHLRMNNRRFVATSCILICITNFVKATEFFYSDILTLNTIILSIKFFPIIIACGWIGSKFIPLLPSNIFRNLIFVLILAISMKSLLSCF